MMLGRVGLRSWFGAALLVLATSVAQAQVRTQFDLPAQSLDTALRAVGTQTGTNILFDPRLLDGRSAPAVQAELTLEEALTRLLAGADLRYRFVDEKTVMIVSVADNSPRDAAGDPHAENLLELNVATVTGTRGRPRSVTESPTPIDVVSGDQLANLLAAVPLRDALTQLVPSFQSMTVGSSSWAAIQKPAGLRGLSGGHVLVLVNGKRRHASGIVDMNSGNLGNGITSVDLDMIPTSAISRIEILRDGAAAQYGSDAIAGVINIILKSNAEGGQFNLSTGQRYDWKYPDGSETKSDGEIITASASHGFPLAGGATTWSFDFKTQQRANRAIKATANFFGANDPRESVVDERASIFGLPRVDQFNISQSTTLPIGGVEAYSFMTFGKRKGSVGQSVRYPVSTNNLLEVYPSGYTPRYTMDETDYQILAGARGAIGDWLWDASTSFGRDDVEHGAKSSLNPSLGVDSPTTFDTMESATDLLVTNFDMTRDMRMFGRPGTLAFGAEHRRDRFSTKAGEWASYANGGYVYPSGSLAGRYASIGAQGAIVVAPEDATDLHRNNVAVYVESSMDATERFFVGAALRFESYDDSAGEVLSGKLSLKYDFTDWFSLRGTASNGFRAPSLSQNGYRQSQSAFYNINGVSTPILTKTVGVDSEIARQLGARSLDPEKSRNFSTGLVITPLPGLSLTADVYRIYIDDRIMLTSFMYGSAVDAILTEAGYAPNQYLRYFTNAIDTRTSGIDVVGTWGTSGPAGSWLFTAAQNYNKTSIRHVADNPEQLQGIGLVLFDRQSQKYLTENIPHDKLILGANWRLGRFGVGLKGTRYGSYVVPGTTAVTDERWSAKWIADVDATFHATPRVSITIGANNLFNTYPRVSIYPTTYGNQPYGGNSPYGYFGGYYYGRVSVGLD